MRLMKPAEEQPAVHKLDLAGNASLMVILTADRAIALSLLYVAMAGPFAATLIRPVAATCPYGHLRPRSFGQLRPLAHMALFCRLQS